jgi:site-specific DNA-methyltransferase (adenine-specific)
MRARQKRSQDLEKRKSVRIHLGKRFDPTRVYIAANLGRSPIVREDIGEFVVKPVFKTKRGLLFNCDCLELLRSIRDESVDCVFSDPPFNLGKQYNHSKVNDARKEEDYLAWCFSWLEQCVRILTLGGSLFVYSLPRWAYHFASFLDGKLQFRHWIALSMKGTFPRGRKLYPAHYSLLYFTKGGPKTFNRVRLPIPACRHCGKDIKDYGGHRKYLNPAGLNLTDFWEDTSPNRHRRSKFRNINELRPMIPERTIRISTNEGDIVLDPFGGGGSTYQAAEESGRLWIGSEIADCIPAMDRLRSELGWRISGEPPAKLHGIFKDPVENFGFRVE